MNCINDFSLSPFIGYSGGVGVFEAAGFINIDRYTVTGIQLAGFGNTVGAYANGVQVAGFYNVVGGSMNGVQAAGFINVVGGGVKGLQAAGFMNIGGGTLDGVQAAGFMNIAFSVKDSYTVEIVSMDGRQMLITDIHTPIYQLDISCFDKGIYFLTVRSKDNVITRKIVKL